MPDKPDLLTLKGVKALRLSTSRDISAKTLSNLTGIAPKRMKELESLDPHHACEPWLTEARAIAHVLRADLMTLLGGTIDHMADVPLGFDVLDALDVWRTGCPLPLRFAIRLALRFGMTDPFDLLSVRPIDRQIWSIVATGERTPVLRSCPWCNQPIVGDAGHLPTCLPELLYGPRDAHLSTIGVMPKPLRPHVKRGGSRPAPGLLVLRTRLGYTQQQMADSLSIARSSYYRIEKMADPLTQTLAEKIATIYKIDIATLYPGGI